MSTLRDQVVANGMVIFRYLCPIILPFLFVGLVVVAGASVGVTILVCSGVLVLVAAGGVGAGGEGESNLTPGRSRTGIFATLFRQAEAL
ncbi:hypothetical protein RSOLAG1IB_04935 [Rhizoctonia solani AG-1 IB]|uniref:Uncharacterized protein n=1 Tax=Thanatephorus cucumeris (strain AG1-IB / isolate 7/3/14) TaxID=1108050 RepID=A0A0B7G0I2_THACB|nr:hypothetical protein RSOLAG1IB_04935 [Rhizoctonia solani AG-1 IB]